jgi:hypothetical protein
MTKIWDWFKSFISNPITGLKDLADKIYAGVKAIIDRLESVFLNIYYAWTHPVVMVKAFVGFVADLARDAAHGFQHAWNEWVMPLLVKTKDLALELVDYFWKAVKKAEDLVTEAAGEIWRYLYSFKSWILDNIWTPLESAFTQTWKWITDKGEILWQLLEHPDRLANLLLKPLAEAAWWFIRESAEVLAQFLLVGWIKAALAIADVLEDVFAKLV